jgi:hypothetical protein
MAYGTAGGIAPVAPPIRKGTPLNRQQIVGFWAAWFGWMLDGMDSVIYALVLGPALTELKRGYRKQCQRCCYPARGCLWEMPGLFLWRSEPPSGITFGRVPPFVSARPRGRRPIPSATRF